MFVPIFLKLNLFYLNKILTSRLLKSKLFSYKLFCTLRSPHLLFLSQMIFKRNVYELQNVETKTWIIFREFFWATFIWPTNSLTKKFLEIYSFKFSLKLEIYLIYINWVYLYHKINVNLKRWSVPRKFPLVSSYLYDGWSVEVFDSFQSG